MRPLRFLTRIVVVMTFVTTCLWAMPHEQVLERVLAIAEPDQIKAYNKLNLTSAQEDKLRALAESYLPRVQQQKKIEPAKMLSLVSEAMGKVDAILTPEQRPIARQLIPRPHQWSKISELCRQL